ncbi:ATP-binding protein [Myxococcus xanthus]|uniref:ATP-binding protein n=1 Tax=Myxococcus TaxID=32 RepID=UPI0011443245
MRIRSCVAAGFFTDLGGIGLQVLENGPCLFHDRAHGLGIDAADLPRIGTPFFRTDLSHTCRTGGVGLWLALARRIVDAHGGARCWSAGLAWGPPWE